MAHIHGVYDTDKHFSIEPSTRALVNQSPEKANILQFDHNSTRVTFDIPRFVEGHDMTQCNVVQIHYLNIDAQTKAVNKGVYEVDDLQPSPEDDTVATCSWLISQNATQLVGPLNFLIRFACVTDGKVDYVWNTTIYSGIFVSSGIYNSDVIVEQYADVLEQWRAELKAAGSGTARIADVELLSANWVGDVHPYSQVVKISGVTENSRVDLTPTVEQLAIFYEKDLTFVTENDGGVVTVYVIGQKPENDYTIPANIVEVIA